MRNKVKGRTKRTPLVAGVVGVAFALTLTILGAWFQGVEAARPRFNLFRFDPLRTATYRYASYRAGRRARISSRTSLASCYARRVAIPQPAPPASPCCP